MPVPKELLYLTEEDVKKAVSISEAVDLAEKGIKADGRKVTSVIREIYPCLFQKNYSI